MHTTTPHAYTFPKGAWTHITAKQVLDTMPKLATSELKWRPKPTGAALIPMENGEMLLVEIVRNPRSNFNHSARKGLECGSLVTITGNEVWRILGWAVTGELVLAHVKSNDKVDRPELKLVKDEKDNFIPLTALNGYELIFGELNPDHIPHLPPNIPLSGIVGSELVSIKGKPSFLTIAPTDIEIYGDSCFIADVPNPVDVDGNERAITERELRASWGFADIVLPMRERVNHQRRWQVPGSPQISEKGLPSKQWLYRFFNEDNELLYVGISNNVLNRWKQHQADKPWFDEVVTFTREKFATRDEVERAEIMAIVNEKPRYNVTYNAT